MYANRIAAPYDRSRVAAPERSFYIHNAALASAWHLVHSSSNVLEIKVLDPTLKEGKSALPISVYTVGLLTPKYFAASATLIVIFSFIPLPPSRHIPMLSAWPFLAFSSLSPNACRCSSDILLCTLNGFLPNLYGYKAQSAIAHSLTSSIDPQLHSRHFVLIAFKGFSFFIYSPFVLLFQLWL